MKVSNLMPKSRLTVTIPIVILIAVFFIGYYFYYIPTNKDGLQKSGFLILQNIKTSILEKNNDFQNLYKNYFNKSLLKNNLQHLLDTNKIVGKTFLLPDSVAAQNGADITTHFTGSDSVLHEFQATGIQQDNLVYLFKLNAHASRIFVPAENILNPVFQSQKTELFESYLLVDKKNGLIYKDPGLSIVSGITIDSLLPRTNAMYASVRDVKLEDIDYKMFSYPFHFANDDVVLCGFIKTKDYNESLHEIPIAFIYPIVIAFLLLLIFLPIIKFYLIGDDETIKFVDVTLSAVSFIVGPALLTLILIQVLLLWSADMRAKSNLESLSSQIDSCFTKEVLRAYRQLDTLDSLISKEDSMGIRMEENDTTNVSNQVITYFQSHKGDPALDYNFNQIFWIDSLGKQKIKGQVGNDELLFNDVSTRKYFKILKNNIAYMLPGSRESFFGFEPVNSWTDGVFRIIISKKSRLKNGVIVAVSTQMPSVTQTILPPGFGFCIIDDAGKVQLHSEMNRNLQENIIDKMSPPRQVREAISSRQASYFNNLKFYGKTNAAYIVPVSKIPFFLITFYDKGYIVPVAMRIFTFALLFCLLSFLIYFLIWVLVFRKHYYVNPMVYSPMVFLKWAIPKKESFQFYVSGKNFLTGYILMLILFMGISGPLGISNYVILVLVLVTPVNVIASLFVISYSTIKGAVTVTSKRVTSLKKKAGKAIAFQLLTSLIVYFYSRYSNYPIERQFLIFQGIFNIAMWAFYFYTPQKMDSSKEEKYLPQYARLATTIILCLAVLPAGLYTWYAHNQEITQSVKKGQLYLAESLQKRRPSIIKFIKSQSSLEAPSEYFDTLKYRSGIYSIYKDSINWKKDTIFVNKQKASYEQFYFAIANDIGNNYYDPLLFPALKDSASDAAWHWARSDTHLFFRYTLPGNFSADNNNKVSVQPLNITSVFPPRYLFVGMTFRGLLLLIIVMLLIRGLYILLRSLANRIFLKKYIVTHESKSHPENNIEHFITEFNIIYKKLYPEIETDVKKLTGEYNYFIPVEKNEDIYKQEKDIIDTIRKLKPFYDFIWQQCSEKEKYLLFDFAKDSLVNFKNIESIYCLLERGLFIIHDSEVKLFSVSFRGYVLGKKDSAEIYQMQKKFQQNSSWQSFRIPVLVILLGIALFIFFTQEATFQKLTAIVAGVSSVLSLLLKFFVDGNSAGTAKK